MIFREGAPVYPYHFASALSIIACFWLFFKYIRQMNKGVKSLLVVILAVSDLIFSANHLLEDFWTEKVFERRIFQSFQNFSICFSIFWASAIAYIVYKNLADRYINLKRLFLKVFFVVLALVLTWIILINWFTQFVYDFYSWTFGPLMISLIVTIVFYQKSIDILRDQSQYEHKSTSVYIRNLRYFSYVQLFTYGPLIILTLIQQSLLLGIGVKYQYWIENSCTTLACLSGFLSVVMFACQGGLNNDAEFGRENGGDLDLTSDILTNT